MYSFYCSVFHPEMATPIKKTDFPPLGSLPDRGGTSYPHPLTMVGVLSGMS